MTDSAGMMSQYFEYDAYGNPYHGDLGDAVKVRFIGQRYLTELGVYSFAYRDYHPRLMRWFE
jgi:RHS repeat-associated protein